MKKAIYLIGVTLLILGFVYSSKPRVIIIEPKKNLAKEKEILLFFKTSDKNFLPFPLEEIKKKLILERTDFIEIDLQEMKAKLYKVGEQFQ